MECKFCKNIFSNKYTLNIHQKKVKYCLKIQQVYISKTEYKLCIDCNKTTSIDNYERHIKTCKKRQQNIIKELMK